MRFPFASGPAAWLRAPDWSARLARGAATLALLEVTALAVTYLSQILFARWLGPREYGIYSYVVGWATLLAPLATLGLPGAVLRFVPQYVASQDLARLRGLIRSAWLVSLSAGCALALGGTTLTLTLNQLQPFESWPAMIIGLWMAPLLGLVSLQTALSRGLAQVGAAFFPSMLLRPLLVVLSAIVLFLASHSLTSGALLGATLGVLPLVILVQLGLFRAALPSGLARARPAYETRLWLGVALPLLLITACSVALAQTGLLVVGALAGPIDAGLYNAAVRTASLIALALAMSNEVAAPQFAMLHARGDTKGLQALTMAVTHWGFWPSLAVAVGLILLAPPLLALFGEAFVAARPVLTILAIGQLANTGAGPVGALLNMTGHHRASLRVTGWMAAANVALTVFGVLYWGLVGAAVATAATMAVWNLWLHRIVARELGIHASILRVFVHARSRSR